MTKNKEWLLKNIPPEGVDILCQDFVDKFIKECNVLFKETNFGAYKCPVLGRTFAKLYREGFLSRGIIDLGINWQPGFPKWVYVYSLNESGLSHKRMLEYIDLKAK